MTLSIAHAGNLVLKALLQVLLPNFLGLLSADYQRWATGVSGRKDTAVGELVRSNISVVPQDWVPCDSDGQELPQEDPREKFDTSTL